MLRSDRPWFPFRSALAAGSIVAAAPTIPSGLPVRAQEADRVRPVTDRSSRTRATTSG